MDDKSAVVTSLYCAKIIKELGIPFNSRLICFTGANEESGMQDIKNYISAHTPPDFSLVCDTGFPLYRGNKGILHFVATQEAPMHDITDFSGGSAFNIILGEAKAKIGEQVFEEKGISRHGALPEGSLNAAHVLSKKLSQNDTLSAYDRKQMDFIANLLEKYYGEVFGIAHTDKDFGNLTVTNGIVKMSEGKISLCFDMRYGASLDIKEAKDKISRFFDNNGWSVDFARESDPFILSDDNPYIVACMNTYKDFTKKHDAKSFVNAGGTYARYLPCAAEIGTSLNGGKPPFDLPAGHGSVHQPDECISIDGLLNAIELTMLMLLECDKQ
jgi:succinyl-diaminopimelate desuccinylase